MEAVVCTTLIGAIGIDGASISSTRISREWVMPVSAEVPLQIPRSRSGNLSWENQPHTQTRGFLKSRFHRDADSQPCSGARGFAVIDTMSLTSHGIMHETST